MPRAASGERVTLRISRAAGDVMRDISKATGITQSEVIRRAIDVGRAVRWAISLDDSGTVKEKVRAALTGNGGAEGLETWTLYLDKATLTWLMEPPEGAAMRLKIDSCIYMYRAFREAADG